MPYQLLWKIIEKFHVLSEISAMLKTYFAGFSLRFSTATFMTSWIDLMVMQVILDEACCYASGQRLNHEEVLPLLRVFVDDTTILIPCWGYAEDLVARLDELINWCNMSCKQKKSRSLSIVKGKVAITIFSWLGGSSLW